MQNNLSFEANLQVSGGFIPLHASDLIDGSVENQTTVTYKWVVNEDNGPAENDASTIAFSYSSNVDPVGDLYAGLFGAVIIARPVSSSCYFPSQLAIPTRAYAIATE